MQQIDPVTFEDVENASRRLRRYLPVSPGANLVIRSDRILTLKLESALPTGSFKVRGALNLLLNLAANRDVRGVTVWSSGNHGAAIAYASALVDLPAVVVMPVGGSTYKREQVRKLGAEVILGEPSDLEEIAGRLAEQRGYSFVPCDHPSIIAGQGVVGMEILAQAPDANRIFVPVGTGSLLAGVAVACSGSSREVEVVGVEPQLAGDAAQSLAAGRRVEWPAKHTYGTVADGLRVTSLGSTAWQIIRHRVASILTVSEAEILRTVAELHAAGVGSEPSGAVGPAAALRHRDRGVDVAVMSGANARVRQG